jgi:hypothetical protein
MEPSLFLLVAPPFIRSKMVSSELFRWGLKRMEGVMIERGSREEVILLFNCNGDARF